MHLGFQFFCDNNIPYKSIVDIQLVLKGRVLLCWSEDTDDSVNCIDSRRWDSSPRTDSVR